VLRSWSRRVWIRLTAERLFELFRAGLVRRTEPGPERIVGAEHQELASGLR